MFYAKTDHKVLNVSGKDAADFLHRLTSANIKTLKIGEAVPALFLSANGKLIAACSIFREENKFLLVSEAGCFLAMREQLEKMHFAEDILFVKNRQAALLLVLKN